ncbi:MAG: glucosaminidase domain-containing protein [Candidatus Gastranaerophilales bacterium]|nr:glucosaminidase domain-containing protein [Candidatus Gastranaerophilales bacterium]
MDFNSIKTGFISYLEEKLEGSDEKLNLVSSSSPEINIFRYSSEFKDYLIDEVGLDCSVMSKDINELMEMEFVNGKLVEPEEDEEDSSSQGVTETAQTNNSNVSDSVTANTNESEGSLFAGIADGENYNEDVSSFMTGMINEAFANDDFINALDTDNSGELKQDEINTFLNGIADEETSSISLEKLMDVMEDIQNGTFNLDDLSENKNGSVNDLLEKAYENKTVLKTLDTDGDGVLSDDEKSKFEEFIIGYDGDSSELTENDVKKAVDAIIDGSFSYDKDLNHSTDTNAEITEVKPSSDSSSGTTSNTGTSNTGSSGGGSYSTGGSSYSGSTASSSDTNVSDSMTLEELEKERTKKSNDVDTARKNIEDIYSGENEAVKQAKQDCETAKEAYEEAVKNDEKISDELKEQMTNNQNDITNKENDISAIKTSVNRKDSEISKQESQITADKSNISSLESTLAILKDSDSEEAEEKAAEVEEQLEQAKQTLTEDENKLKTLNSEKKELESSLSTNEDALNTLKISKTSIQQQILANCDDETKTALEAYNTANENIQKVQESELQTANSELENAQSALNDIDTKINEKKAEKTKKDYAVSSLPEGLFKSGGALEGKEALVSQIAEQYNIEPEFFAAIICLESGYGTSNLAVTSNNFGGVTGTGDAGSVNTSTGYTFASYSSVEKGLDAIAKNLAAYSSRYSDVNAVDIDNVSAIGNHYCVGGDWANKVKTLYDNIKSM